MWERQRTSRKKWWVDVLFKIMMWSWATDGRKYIYGWTEKKNWNENLTFMSCTVRNRKFFVIQIVTMFKIFSKPQYVKSCFQFHDVHKKWLIFSRFTRPQIATIYRISIIKSSNKLAPSTFVITLMCKNRIGWIFRP